MMTIPKKSRKPRALVSRRMIGPVSIETRPYRGREGVVPVAYRRVNRVLRLMRQYQLLALRRLGPPNGIRPMPHDHDDGPGAMWGTDAPRFYTEEDGWCWFFVAIDHGIDELLGWHVAKLGGSLTGLGANPSGRPPRLRRLPEGRCLRARRPARLGSAGHRRCVDQGGEVTGDYDLALVCWRARVQWRHPALHADRVLGHGHQSGMRARHTRAEVLEP